MRITLNFIAIIWFLFLAIETNAQVTIGNGEKPAEGALLQLKQWEPIDPNADNSNSMKGLGLPRVALKNTHSLEPLLNLGDKDYEEKNLLYQGLLIYNVTEDEAKGLSLGVYVWTGEQFWRKQEDIGSGALLLKTTPNTIPTLTSGHGSVPLEPLDLFIEWGPKFIPLTMELVHITNGGVDWALPSENSGVTGAYNLKIDPKPFSANEIKDNPFLEKKSILTITSSDYQGNTLKKDLEIIQKNRDILIEGLFPFMDLGREYKIKVACNTNWSVEINDPEGIVDICAFPIGIQSEMPEGAEYTFKLKGLKGNEGKKMSIKFSNSENLWDDRDYTIEAIDYYPNSYFVEPGATIEIPVRKVYGAWANDLLEPISKTIDVSQLSADLLWQDEKGLISSINIDKKGIDSKIKVETNSSKEGNAIINFRIGGKIKWSWHLWIMPYKPDQINSHVFPEQTSSLLNVDGGIVYSYFNGKKRIISLDRHLGAIKAEGTENAVRMQGYFVQWGRKDITPPLSTIQSGNISVPLSQILPLYDINNNLLTNLIQGNGNSVAGVNGNTLKFSIENPTILYYGTTGDWYSFDGEHNNELWYQDDGLKGVYDPCPQGWRVGIGGSNVKSPFYNLQPVGPSAVNTLDFRSQFGGNIQTAGIRYPHGSTSFPHACYIWTVDASLKEDDQAMAEIFNGTCTPWRPHPRSTSMMVRCTKDESQIILQ